jgi:hypothetical protein
MTKVNKRLMPSYLENLFLSGIFNIIYLILTKKNINNNKTSHMLPPKFFMSEAVNVDSHKCLPCDMLLISG